MFGVEPALLGEAAMVGSHQLLTDSIAEMARNPFRQAAGVDKNERRSMLANQRGQAIVVLLPNLVRHHGIERRLRNLDRQISGAPMPFVDDGAPAAAIPRADEEMRDLLDRFLCR